MPSKHSIARLFIKALPFPHHGHLRMARLSRNCTTIQIRQGECMTLPTIAKRLGEAGERNLPLPPLPTPLSLPARPLPPASPPTHPLAGSRLSPVPPPAAAPLPARSTPAPARCSRGENETERKSCSWDSEGRRWGGRVGKLTEQHERRSPFHFLALVLPGFAAISSAGGSEMSVAQVTRDAPQPE